MKKLSTKISLFGMVFGAIFWLGATNVRAIIGAELLETGTMTLIPGLDETFQREIFRLISYSSLIVMGGYFVVFVSAFVFARTTTLSIRREGWLMISAIMFFMFSPVEFYTAYLDGRMAMLELFYHPALDELQRLFIHRLAALAGVPMIALLCYYTIIGLVIWQPMKHQDPG
jgi:hypothetical protein